MDFLIELLNGIEQIFTWLIDAIIDLIDVISQFPLLLADLIKNIGGVLGLFGEALAAVPDKVWFAIFLSALVYFIKNTVYGKKGGK